jgi:hypothetical protein
MSRTVYRVWHDDYYMGESEDESKAHDMVRVEQFKCSCGYPEEYCDRIFIQTVEIDDNGDEWEIL